MRSTGLSILMVAVAFAAVDAVAATGSFEVRVTSLDDRKAVFGSVEARRVVDARTRIGGTVAELVVDEGSQVEAGERIALVVDPKLRDRLAAADAGIQALESRKDLAASTLDRMRRLFRDGHVSRARLDEAETEFNVADRELKGAIAERKVVLEQEAEGIVRAPAAGRVLKVPITTGTVVLPGDSLATIAVEGYILRVELPERHARFLHVGDRVQVGRRGLEAPTEVTDEILEIGRVIKVYPQIREGRVIADVDVVGLGDFFVGERVRVYVSTGERPAFVIPREYVLQRHGVSFVKLEDGRESVVQPGLPAPGGIEILSGLKVGDILVPPPRP